ncbi:hypothetical protein K9M48_01195 [Candidatus Gracilibacteria bacterium]|nr:hypothetical protein [Candidatus Gracilibacteria bacterium]
MDLVVQTYINVSLESLIPVHVIDIHEHDCVYDIIDEILLHVQKTYEYFVMLNNFIIQNKMKNKKFIHHKIGHKHEIKLRNIAIIFLSILIGLGSLTVFGLVIPSSLSNTVQTIGRIVISTDGTDNIFNRLYDFNQDGSGKIKVYLPNINSGINRDSNRANNSGRKFLGIDLSTDGNSGSDLVFIDKDFFSSTGFWGSGIIGGTSGDNLGDHTATGNLKMAGHRITNDGDNEGILIDNAGNILISGGNLTIKGFGALGDICVFTDGNGTLYNAACSLIGDDLGNHQAIQNIELNDNRLSDEGSDRGIKFIAGSDSVILSSLSGQITGGGTQCVVVNDDTGILSSTGCASLINNYYGGDNLGNHSATMDIKTNGYRIVQISGQNNGILLSNDGKNISLGSNTNQIGGTSLYSSILGGSGHIISYSSYSNIAGGQQNVMNNGSSYGFIGGGYSNYIRAQTGYSATHSAIVGGYNNSVFSTTSIVGGGSGNIVNDYSDYGVIVGGEDNEIVGSHGFIGGGRSNSINGNYSTIPGGRNAIASHNNSFVRNGDSGISILASQGTGSWTTKAPGGYYLYTNRNNGLFIDDNGDIQSTSLMGIGDRCLYVDNYGRIQATDCDNLSGDNLGNHQATQNIELNDNRISKDGDPEGIRINDNGKVSIATGNANAMLHIYTDSDSVPFLALEDKERTLYRGSDTTKDMYYLNVGAIQNNKPHFTIKGVQGGGIGIKVEDPTETLDIGGNIRSRNLSGAGNRCLYANASGIILAANCNSLVTTGSALTGSNTGDDLGNHIAIQNINLGNNRLSPNGLNGGIGIDPYYNVKISSLAGVGNRCLYADSNGTLQATGCDSLSGDNLGDHEATENLKMNGYWITKDGTSEGILIKDNGNIIIGDSSNSINLAVLRSIIGGGSSHQIDSNFSTIGGGFLNYIGDGGYSTIGGGSANHTTQEGATIGGGTYNNANGYLSTVGGGTNNNANGDYSTIPGGIAATAVHNNSFVWNGGGIGNILFSQGIGTFTTRAPGGYYLYTSGTNQGVFIDKDGYIKTSSLIGTGDRCVFVNSGGVLQATGCIGDNLGNHIATENLQMSGHRITKDGDDEGILIDSIGNVGIGKTPTYILDVNNTARISGNVILSNQDNRSIFIASSPTHGKNLTVHAGDYYNAQYINANYNGGTLYLRGGSKHANGLYGNVIIAHEGGNVSIGTQESLARTTISGDIAFTKGSNRSITLETEPTGDGRDLTISAGNTNEYYGFGGDLILNGGASSGAGRGGSIYLNLLGPYYNSTTNVYIAGSGGRVAIGTNSQPSLNHKLDVNGKIRMRNQTEISDSDDTVVTKGYLGANTAPPLNLNRRKGRSSNSYSTAIPTFEELAPSYTCSIDGPKFSNSSTQTKKVLCGYYNKCYITKQKGGNCSITYASNKAFLETDGNASCEASCSTSTIDNRRMEYTYYNMKRSSNSAILYINGSYYSGLSNPNAFHRTFDIGSNGGCQSLVGSQGHMNALSSNLDARIMNSPTSGLYGSLGFGYLEFIGSHKYLRMIKSGGGNSSSDSLEVMCRKYIQ